MEQDIIDGLLVLGMLGTALTAVAHFAAHRTLRRRRTEHAPMTPFTPPISVLKPLKGVDDNLYGNLVSFLRQDYPCFEVLLGVDDANDPAVAIARQLQADFPRAPLRLVIRRNRSGLNPKVNNLSSLLEESRYAHVLISDSNVLVARDYLRTTVAPLADARVGMVSNVVVGAGEQTIGALIENLQLNTFILAGVCLGDGLGHPVVVGKSMLMRRVDLLRAGGLHGVRDVLAEDYVLGQRMDALGMQVILSAHAVCTVNQHWSLQRTLSRHTRWAKLRKFLHPSAFAIEPLTAANVWFATAAIAAACFVDAMGLQLAFAGLLLKSTLDACLFAAARSEHPSLRAWPASLVRDALMLGAWCWAAVSRTVDWRGNRLRIGRGTVLTPIAPIDHSQLEPREVAVAG